MIVVGIDVGGTFTDVTAIDESRTVRVAKVPSQPRDEAAAVLAGLAALGIDARDVRRLVHGTTVGTNAILERRGARVAVVTTAGFRDLLEIGRTKRNIPALFVPTFVRPRPVVPRSLRFEVVERLGADGAVLTPLDTASLDAALKALATAQPEAVAVCFLHAYANPAHERAVAEALGARFPALPVCTSAEVVPEYREFERFSTTVLNAYLQPLLDRYLSRLEKRLLESGYTYGVLTVGSSGGVMTVDTARRLPIKTIFSGPAGGVSQACVSAGRAGLGDFITYDMGGTSTDVCLVRDGRPLTTTDNLVGAFPVKVPQIDLRTVGAGGGSIAWIDVDGSLRVGPQSAGARPGPAAYGQGGTAPTVTDANVVLGRMGADRTLGGVIRLDPALARAAVAALGQALGGMTAEATADGIVRIAVARMTSSIREISIERGHDPRDFTLIAFGGAGPMHAIPIAEELGIPRVVVPPHPGNFSALGLLASDVKHDDVRTRIGRLDESAAAIAALAGEMENAAAARLDAEGFVPPARRMEHSLDLRYAGQAFELNVPRPAGPPSPAALAADFHARHLATYGHSDPEGVVELVNVRLAAYGLYPEGASAALPAPPPEERRQPSRRMDHIGRGETPPPIPAPDQSGTRVVWFDGRPGACSIHARAGLSAGVRLTGSAIVEESGATSVVFPGWVATVDAWGNLRLERG